MHTLIIINIAGLETYHCYYNSGRRRVFDRVTEPIRDMINRDDVKRTVTHINGGTKWEITLN